MELHASGSGFRLYDSPTIWLIGAGYLSVSVPVGVQLAVFFCSIVSVVLMTPKGYSDVSTRCKCRVLILASIFSLILIVAHDDH